MRPAGVRWGPHMLPAPADYPWRWSQAIPMNSALIKWLYLPDFLRAPDSTSLISECPRLGPTGCLPAPQEGTEVLHGQASS